MKNVLSPISDRKISAKAARKPDLPRTEFCAQSCKTTNAFAPLSSEKMVGWVHLVRKTHTLIIYSAIGSHYYNTDALVDQRMVFGTIERV